MVGILERVDAVTLRVGTEAPPPSSPAATAKGKGNRRADTSPELRLRRGLWARGLRFRKDFPIRPAGHRAVRADIVFPRARLAVFVDGCFWHSCPQHGRVPRSNREYWEAKLRNNRQRDLRVTKALEAECWTVMRVWEHEELADALDAVEKRYWTLRLGRALTEL